MNRKNPYRGIGRENYRRTVRRRSLHHRLACISLMVLVVICAAAVLAPVIAPYGPDAIAGPFGAPSGAGFLLGTDQIGWGVFFRPLYATRISLLVGMLATAISTTIEISLGLLGGYFGGWLDIVIMRFTDVAMSFPHILLVLMAAAIFGSGSWSIILILGFVGWPSIVRLTRDNVLSPWETNFVENSTVTGMPARHILFSEILPDTAAPILVYITPVMVPSMLGEVSLSFLGIGMQPPTASLGNMLNSAQSLAVLTKRLWLWIPPGFLIVVLMVAINFVGDALRDALDPSTVLNLDGAEPDIEDQDIENQEAADSI